MAVVQIDVAFGKTGIKLNLPDRFRYQILEARSAVPLPDWSDALEQALDYLVGTSALADMAKGKRTAAISICDITRPVPNRLILPAILKRLEASGISRENTTILIATGLHRAASDAEIREICGEEIASGWRVLNHDARDLASHRHLGATASGTPVHIDERFIAADLHITVGFIEPHLMAGFSGGRKLVAPGLAAQETIKVLHSPKFMRDARASEGSIQDNPLHRELLEISRMARHDFLVDVALTRDKAIAAFFAGEPEQAHARGVQFVSRVMHEQLAEPADAVITSSAGYPLDLTWYQAIKGVTASQHVVKPGGPILLVAACEEGAGAPEFRGMMMEGLSDTEFLDYVATHPVTVDQWQLEKLALVTKNHPLICYVPGLEAEYQTRVWGYAAQTLSEAVEKFAASLPANANIAVIPEGPYVLASCGTVSGTV